MKTILNAVQKIICIIWYEQLKKFSSGIEAISD